MKNVTIDKASEHVLSCDFFGYPSPIVSWTFNGQPANREAFHTLQMPAIRPRGEIVTTSYLRFTPRSLLYSGSYRCMAAENALHMTEIQVYIQGAYHAQFLTNCHYIRFSGQTFAFLFSDWWAGQSVRTSHAPIQFVTFPPSFIPPPPQPCTGSCGVGRV